MTSAYDIAFHEDLSTIAAQEWNALVSAGNPFLEYDFLRNLEKSGSVGKGAGWEPVYITVRKNETLQAALALYIKMDSYGEFIFDFEWARAHHQYGIHYYPKGIVAVPFTPVTGERLVLRSPLDEEARELLLEALLTYAEKKGLSSLHFLFLKPEECDFLQRKGFSQRLHYQFHWKNNDYHCFEDYLGDLQHKRKNQILRERRRVEALGLKIHVLQGDQIQREHLEAMWQLSARTFLHKSGDFPYLTESFFQSLYENFRHRTLLVLAQENEAWVAGSINFLKDKNLYGRYWGAAADYPFLHFECCFYRLIEYAIEHGIELFEAGAQGEQKFFRGFGACPTYSMHWIRDPVLKEAINAFLKEESKQIQRVMGEYNALSPLKRLREKANE